MTVDTTVFETLEDFYAAKKARFSSGEADYGTQWTIRGYPPFWRVSYIQATGEIYAVCHDTKVKPRVRVLGVVPPDAEGSYYATLDKILAGWPNHNTLSWVRFQLGQAKASVV